MLLAPQAKMLEALCPLATAVPNAVVAIIAKVRLRQGHLTMDERMHRYALRWALQSMLPSSTRHVECCSRASACTSLAGTNVSHCPAMRVFDMFPLVSLPAGDAEACPPAVLPPDWRSVYQARQRTANVVLVLAKASPQVRAGPRSARCVLGCRWPVGCAWC